MAKVSHLVCDVTGIADETVQSVRLTFPMKDDTSAVGEYKTVTLALDIASKALDDILAKVGKDIKPLLTENTTATVRGANAKTKDENGEDAPVQGSPADIRAWANANGHKVNERGAIPKVVKDAYAAAHPVTDDEATDDAAE